MKLEVLGAVLALVALSSARTVRQSQRAHFLGDGSNDVAVNILQSLKNSKENAIFSPLGYTTLLAVLTEGARGNTRNQLVSSLKLPEDTYAVRSTYKRILSEMTEREVMNKPQFQNWFYVYKNYSVEQSFKDVLKDNYLIDVKETDRYEFDEESSEKPMEVEGTTAVQPSQPMEMDGTNDKIVEESVPEVTTKKIESSEEDDKSKEKSAEKKGSKEKESEENESKEDESSEDKSKEDESKEDSEEEKGKPSKKPSNVMKIKEKGNKDKPSMGAKESSSVVYNSEDEKPQAPEDVKKEPEALETMTTDRPSDEAMQSEVQAQPIKAVQVDSQSQNIDFRSRTRRDMASAVSTNKLIENEKQSNLRRISRIMAFNALFFQGNWSSKFSLKKEKMPFKVSANDQMMVEVLHAEGEFETGRVPDLDAWALDLPYQGERYSLLVLVPAGDDGLDGLIQRLNGFSFYNVDKHLTKLPAQVCIPKLKFYTITKPKDAFIKSGITDLFSEEADLSGISGSKGLYLEELVQIVTFNIDENESSYNYLTSSDVSDTRAAPVNFSADQPFLFFLRDKVENLNIVTGMVNNPIAKELKLE